MSAELVLRRALRASANRHWLARLVLATWALCIVLFAFLSPDSSVARAMEKSGHMGYLMMAVLGLLAAGALTDSAIHDLVPGRLQHLLMLHRHAATMGMAIALVIEGGALAVTMKAPLMVGPFLVLAVFCGFVTYLDLRAKSRERCQ